MSASLPAEAVGLDTEHVPSLAGFVMRVYGYVPTFLFGLLALGGYFIWTLYKNQESLLYHPVMHQLPPAYRHRRVSDMPAPYNSPADAQWGMSYEEAYVQAADGVRIHLWLIKAPASVDSKAAPTIVYSHANAGHIGFRLPLAKLITESLGVNMILWDYRGYGNSDGTPEEEGINMDATAVLSWAHEKPDLDNRLLVLFGQSLGGAVAMRSAVMHGDKIAGALIENTFTSLSDLVDILMPWLAPIKYWVLRMRWDTLSLAPNLTAPVLFLSGLRDELIPPAMMAALHSACLNSSDRSIHVVPDGTHNDTFMVGGAAYLQAIRDFISRVAQRRTGKGWKYQPAAVSAGATTTAAAAAAAAVPLDERPAPAEVAAAAVGTRADEEL